ISSSNETPQIPSSSDSSGSGAHYALCALGLGLIALGVVMIVWTVVPMDGEASSGSTTTPASNSSNPGDGGDEVQKDTTKSSTIAMVLVAVGAILLVLSISLGFRNKRRARARGNQTTAAVLLASGLPERQEEPAVDPAAFSVPSYDEVVGSGEFPVRQSNLRQSTSQLPSYEDIIAAVENEGADPAENSRLTGSTKAPAPSAPARSSSRASRLLRPLRVRRIKSDKLHLKDFRLQIRSPTQNPVTIEPITPPPQYDTKTPEF
uniref:Transmembrane protein 51b n=1 Tax=Tetraodon nigroviridis TaxID=99883 RepID=H3DBC3_TETNG